MKRLLKIAFLTFLIPAGLFGLVWCALFASDLRHYRIGHKSTSYYVALTAAFDAVLTNHLLPTNETASIPVNEHSLPKIITDLHPVRIEVSHEKFWVMLGSDSRSGVALVWHPRWNNSNIWDLNRIDESWDDVIYSTNRGLSPMNILAAPSDLR